MAASYLYRYPPGAVCVWFVASTAINVHWTHRVGPAGLLFSASSAWRLSAPVCWVCHRRLAASGLPDPRSLVSRHAPTYRERKADWSCNPSMYSTGPSNHARGWGGAEREAYHRTLVFPRLPPPAIKAANISVIRPPRLSSHTPHLGRESHVAKQGNAPRPLCPHRTQGRGVCASRGRLCQAASIPAKRGRVCVQGPQTSTSHSYITRPVAHRRAHQAQLRTMPFSLLPVFLRSRYCFSPFSQPSNRPQTSHRRAARQR